MVYEAAAAHVNLVAIGGSNTAGKGVGPAFAYPAQLEAMLWAKGYDVNIANAGISGDASSGVLGRLESDIPNGTNIVILHTSMMNARAKGISPQQRLADIGEIMRRLRVPRIKVIYIDKMLVGIPRRDIQTDRVHLKSLARSQLRRVRTRPALVPATAMGRLRMVHRKSESRRTIAGWIKLSAVFCRRDSPRQEELRPTGAEQRLP